MLSRLSKMLVVVALVATTGLHWMALQTVAWTTMLANNLESASLEQAITKTFDGEHPCCLCRAIAAAKKSEKKTDSAAQRQKLEYPPLTQNFVLIAPVVRPGWPLNDSAIKSRTQKPLLQPPRRFFV